MSVLGAAAIGAAGSIAGGLIGSSSAKKQAEAQAELQKEFAQYGIRWKVADAKAAGLHPLAALGAQTISYQPMAVGDYLGAGIADAGQEIGRAINATRDRDERNRETALALQRMKENDQMQRDKHYLDMQRGELENAILASQLKRQQVMYNPPMPVASSGNKSGTSYRVAGMGDYDAVRPEVANSRPGDPSLTAGPPAPVATTYATSLGNVRLPSEASANALEAMGWAAPFYVWGDQLGAYGKSLYRKYFKSKPKPKSTGQTGVSGKIGVYYQSKY